MSASSSRILLYALVPIMTSVAVVGGLGGEPLPDARHAVRATAGVAFGFFVVVYFARPLRDLAGVKWPMTHRRVLGHCVAAALTAHYLCLVAYFSLADESVLDDRLRFVTGMIGVVLLYAMALTSNNAAVRKLGARWRQLHRIGLHYLWFFFAVSYLLPLRSPGVASGPRAPALLAAGAILMLGLALRLASWRRAQVTLHTVAARVR